MNALPPWATKDDHHVPSATTHAPAATSDRHRLATKDATMASHEAHETHEAMKDHDDKPFVFFVTFVARSS